MIIDGVTFSEIVTHLKRASVTLVNAAESIDKLTEIERNPAETELWIHTIENLATTNNEMGMLNDILRAVYAANNAESRNDPTTQ